MYNMLYIIAYNSYFVNPFQKIFWKASLTFQLRSVIIAYGKLTFRDCGGERLKNRLEEIRKKNNIKQEELAERLEVSRQTIGSLENGRYNPSIILAFKIARFFKASIEEIFIYEEESK